MSQPTWVYVIGRRGGPCKIGVSGNLQSRLSTIKTSCPFDVDLWGSMLFPSFEVARRFEFAAHRYLDADRMAGEWFDVEPEIAIEAIETSPGYRESYVRDGDE